jgi:CheY-like chemotaxis protein
VSGRRTALVVDDDPDIRKIITAWLTQLGFDVRHASDGRAAITALTQSPPLLLCLDLMLPESSGYDVCEHVQRTPALKDVRVLMISARSLPEDRALAEELGARAYLSKPFTQADFVRSVNDALADDPPTGP